MDTPFRTTPANREGFYGSTCENEKNKEKVSNLILQNDFMHYGKKTTRLSFVYKIIVLELFDLRFYI